MKRGNIRNGELTNRISSCSILSPFVSHLIIKMAFRPNTDCRRYVCQRVGLYLPTTQAPREDDNVRFGEEGCDVVACVAHVSPIRQDLAQALFAALPDDFKTDPQTIEAAEAVAVLALYADRQCPQRAADVCNASNVRPTKLTYYCTPGSPILISKSDSGRLISFIFKNTTPHDRVKWYDMTGREQFEWYEAWKANGKTHDVTNNPDSVLGLRGTDISTISTADQLTAALTVSPTLATRRPADHTLDQPTWNNARRSLAEEFAGAVPPP